MRFCISSKHSNVRMLLIGRAHFERQEATAPVTGGAQRGPWDRGVVTGSGVALVVAALRNPSPWLVGRGTRVTLGRPSRGQTAELQRAPRAVPFPGVGVGGSWEPSAGEFGEFAHFPSYKSLRAHSMAQYYRKVEKSHHCSWRPTPNIILMDWASSPSHALAGSGYCRKGRGTTQTFQGAQPSLLGPVSGCVVHSLSPSSLGGEKAEPYPGQGGLFFWLQEKGGKHFPCIIPVLPNLPGGL